jgi:peptide/nickel transport system substrate-binding protein
MKPLVTNKIKHGIGVIILSIIAYFIFFSCQNKQNLQDKMIFRYNESSGITSLDPAFSSGQSTIWACHQLFNGLVALDDSLHIVPAIAKGWSISADGKSYTFILRSDVLFHNTNFFPYKKDRVVIASDFVYSFSRILNPKVASPGAWIFQKVATNEKGYAAFEAINDTVFKITLKEAFPPFLGILTMSYCAVVPYEAVEQFGKDFRKNPVGTGPFQMQLWKEGVKLVLRKNPNYFERDTLGNPLPYIDAVSISFIVDKQSVFMEFMKGSLDFMSGVEACYKDALLTSSGELNPEHAHHIYLIKGPYLNTEYLGFNLHSEGREINPMLIKEVRQAINYGFDREKMLLYLRNNIGFAGIHGFIPKGMPNFDFEGIKGYDYNPEKAVQLLAQAGFPYGKGLPPISVSISASYLDISQYIQHELSNIGIQLKIEVLQAAQQRQMMRSYRLPFFRGSWICDYPDAENYLSLFYSDNLQPLGSNYTHYTNSYFDYIFEKSQNTFDDRQRGLFYTQLDSILMADAPVVVLYYDEVIRFVHSNVKNLGTNPINMLDLRRVTIEND